jgi:hypothetical protein
MFLRGKMVLAGASTGENLGAGPFRPKRGQHPNFVVADFECSLYVPGAVVATGLFAGTELA